MLAPFTVELDKLAPSFKINGSQVHVLQSPAEFYEALKVGDHRITSWEPVR